MLYEILKTAKLGTAAAPDMFTGLLAQKMPFAKGSGEIAELSGVPPLRFKSNGKLLLDWRIVGNTVQGGNPTPSNPVDVVGVGKLETSSEHSGQYEIGILSANTTTSIYLGEVETTRKIKKLVFDGTENFERAEIQEQVRYSYRALDTLGKPLSTCISTHFRWVSPNPENPQVGDMTGSAFGNAYRLFIFSDKPTLADFQAYLAAQYANGTPVTIWYVLATPEKAVVNEPLQKIGNYADTLSMTDTGIVIPTFRGNNVLTVDTTVQPSEVYIKYKK